MENIKEEKYLEMIDNLTKENERLTKEYQLLAENRLSDIREEHKKGNRKSFFIFTGFIIFFMWYYFWAYNGAYYQKTITVENKATSEATANVNK